VNGSPSSRWAGPARCGALALLVALAALPARAQDSVHIATGDDGRGRAKATGQIIDLAGNELRMKSAGGAERVVPADRILRIETARTREQDTADEQFAADRFDEAAVQYQAALKREERGWMRREIIAQLVACYRAAGNVSSAAEYFLLLVRSDPATRHFDAIPLAWLPGLPAADVEGRARRWIDQRDVPAAMLLGASHLLTTPQGDAARGRLQELASGKDSRIAALARTQLWRDRIASADDAELDRWQADIDRLPESVRAGPTFILAHALAQRKRYEQAALGYLRVPILYPSERALAARSLLEAGRTLEKLDQSTEAARLYREVLSDHGQDPAAIEAQDRLAALVDRKS
jgi:tetratricopeptide (TPR) repeat protein